MFYYKIIKNEFLILIVKNGNSNFVANIDSQSESTTSDKIFRFPPPLLAIYVPLMGE